MCIASFFGGKDNGLAAQQLALAQQQQQQAAAAVANANGDTESSRQAAEMAMRRANASQGFATTVMGGTQAPASIGFKQLFGQ